jgi:tyrosyl-tRNA synthetase
MTVMVSLREQLDRIRRGVEQITPENELVKKLERSIATQTPLRVKYGIDPTGIDVHLGHTVPLRKMRVFQELGHQAVLIIGNYTALVGDPSGRDQTRARLTPEQVEANARDYLAQIERVIDIKKTEVRHNGEWFSRMNFLEVMSLMSQITVQRMIERDDFSKRFKSDPSVPIYLHECLYPLMQGWDSVEIKADIELGGSEQLFNLMVGRRLQEDCGQEPQICLTLPILRGLDGERRMGKSLGNYIGVGMGAQEQFDKTMSIPDSLLEEWFCLLTDWNDEQAQRLIAENPFEAKKQLGTAIAACYHEPEVAQAARREWERIHSQGNDPTDIPDADLPLSSLAAGKMPAAKLLVALNLAKSGSTAKELVKGGGMNIGPTKEKVTDPNALIDVTTGQLVRVGPKRIVRVRVV